MGANLFLVFSVRGDQEYTRNLSPVLYKLPLDLTACKYELDYEYDFFDRRNS